MQNARTLVYGLNPALETVIGKRRKIYKAYVSTGSSPKFKSLLNILKTSSVPIQKTDKGRLFNLVRTKNHQGVVLETEPYPYVTFNRLFEKGNKLLLIDNIEDPHNLGAVLRNAEIFGFKNVLLPSKGSPEIYSSVVKVSSGATEHLFISRDMTANGYVKKSIEYGFKIAALDEKADTDLNDLKENLKTDKFMLVIGGEDKSVGQYILNNADYIVKIPQKGKINSLNASVASGIAMYALS
ncbi:MAG: 23S rRNA (guanosine(2251)-2'-O)-methyltransferase RlmB [Victivallales bacterium]|nr:23S rRNA (guanosine(2251)-2'-O)-methyltransferase RlmB [Victivallales bacterium]